MSRSPKTKQFFPIYFGLLFGTVTLASLFDCWLNHGRTGCPPHKK